MGQTNAKTFNARLDAWATKMARNTKVWIAIAACLLLAVSLVLLQTPWVTWVAAAFSAGLLVVKEVSGTIGVAVEADAMNDLEKARAVRPLDAESVDQAKGGAEEATRLKRTLETRAAVCGMFATIFGVPAAVALVQSL